jgi:pimeloyl-ACP methyl ester carboxylesterase
MTEPVMMVPGLMCDGRAFTAQMAVLGRTRPILLVLPTLGVTVEEMAQAALAVAPQRFALVGMGLGGDVGLEILRRAPDRVTRIAMISTDPLAETPVVAAAREARIVAARAGRLPQALAEEIPDNALSDGPARDRVRRTLEAMWQNLGAEVFVQQSRAMQRRPDHQRTLRATRVPALFIAGMDDPLVTVRRQHFAAGLMPLGRLETIAHAGHLPSMEAPDAVSDALERFLREPLLLR